jgi:hypothetical protein
MDELEQLLALLNSQNVQRFEGCVPTVYGQLDCKVEFFEGESDEGEFEVDYSALEITTVPDQEPNN